MNDRQILARLEVANATEFSRLLTRPNTDEDRVYRLYFGPERYEALRRKSLRGTRALRAAKRGNLVILHGIMGGELTVFQQNKPRPVWMKVPQLIFGGVGWLRMTGGKSEFDVRATGILKKWYAEQILELEADWTVQVYCYDWRRDIYETANDLRAKIDGWFGASAPVSLVAHSMGGLVSRAYIARHAARWSKGGKLIMLGTPNHGSFAIPQVITGVEGTVRKLDLIDVKHNRAEILDILAVLPGSLQMLPSPLVMPAMAALYRQETWGGRVPQVLLDDASRFHDSLVGVVDGERMHYIAGCNRHTYDDVFKWDRLDELDGYSASMNGDGTVPHRLGFLEQDGKRIPTWFVEEDHGALPNNTAAINAVEKLLLSDRCDLPTTIPGPSRSPAANRSAARAASEEQRARRLADDAKLALVTEKLRTRTRSADQAEDAALGRDEMVAQEIILRSFLSGKPAGEDFASAEPPPPRKSGAAQEPEVKVEIALVQTDLTNLFRKDRKADSADAVAVGHYIGVTPQYAELALDRAVSDWKEGHSDDDLLITALHKRGSLPAQLGQVFVLPARSHPAKVAALAGMGEPGTFGTPQLTIAVRELVWAMGRLKCPHLASVLIGAGIGNMSVPEAVRAWLRGLRRALYDARASGTPGIERLTIVELSAETFLRIDHALGMEIESIGAKNDPEPLIVKYIRPTEKAFAQARAEAKKAAVRRATISIDREFSGKKPGKPALPVAEENIRFTVRLNAGTYEFSILRSEASIPQRDVKVDPVLIGQINDQLPAAASPSRQRDLGNLLGRMLIPAEIREHVMKVDVPTVLAVDATTARIHFEAAALSPAGGAIAFDEAEFLGTAASLTRQLRTTFAPLPEPPIVTGRTLRVLVIADPCEEASLPGAQEEGEAVAQIFEQCADDKLDIEVVRLFGPAAATRVSVLDHLINQRFDMLHYAGHCFYNPDDPAASGWLFSGNEVLSASELSRIDRIPRFVFSNACESGITPDRLDARQAGMAPSFAEAFFARGVANFICTAWPVDDAAAVAFASRLYQGLLDGAEPLHAAMRAARIKIATMDEGGRGTWGAYQHYGDPFFRVTG